MNFMQILQSLDELLYEVMSWLVFYPITLWRAVRHPLRTMAYAERELGDTAEAQYTETLSPPMFLLLTLLIVHGVELLVIGDSPIVASRHGLSSLISDDNNLIAFRMLCFALFPLVMGTRMLRLRHSRIDRDALKAPFYSQCFITAPFALVFSLAGTFSQAHWWTYAPLLALAVVTVMAVAYVVVQAKWFAKQLSTGIGRGVWNACAGYAETLVILLIVLMFFR